MTDDKMIRLVDALNVPFPPDWLDRANGFQGGLKMQAAWRDGFYACLNAIEALNAGKEVMPNGTSKVPNNDIGPGDQGAVAGAAGHRSDCAIHNAPAYPAGPCDCGFSAGAAEDFETELIDSWIKRNDPDLMREDRDARSELDREYGE